LVAQGPVAQLDVLPSLQIAQVSPLPGWILALFQQLGEVAPALGVGPLQPWAQIATGSKFDHGPIRPPFNRA